MLVRAMDSPLVEMIIWPPAYFPCALFHRYYESMRQIGLGKSLVSNSNELVLYKYFDDLWVSQKTLWTGAGPICTGLENHYQIARFGNGQCHAVCQNIQWRA